MFWSGVVDSNSSSKKFDKYGKYQKKKQNKSHSKLRKTYFIGNNNEQ